MEIGKWVSETSAAVRMGVISVNSEGRRSDLSSMTGATLGECAQAGRALMRSCNSDEHLVKGAVVTVA